MKKHSTTHFAIIDKTRLNEACLAYFKWKELNEYISKMSWRGMNMSDAISSPIACYCLNLLLNIGGTTFDATDLAHKEQIVFKSTTRFEGDLSSFGPECKFSKLFLLRFNIKKDLLFIYDLNMSSDDLSKIKINSFQTFSQQQQQGRRPHLSLIKMIITPKNLGPLIVFNLATQMITIDNK